MSMDYASGTTVSFGMGLVCDGGGMYVCMVVYCYCLLFYSFPPILWLSLSWPCIMYNTYYTHILSTLLALCKINVLLYQYAMHMKQVSVVYVEHKPYLITR